MLLDKPVTLAGHIGRASKHQLVLSSRDGAALNASAYALLRFVVAEAAGSTALLEKLSTTSGHFSLLATTDGTLAYQVNIAAADFAAQTAPRALYWQLEATPTGGEAEVVQSGLYQLEEAS